MKKVLFFMFLLFLIVLGTVGVKAQVRIGGNTAPQGAAVLDLNADNTATPAANKGALALPRVSLASTTAQLNGTTPITGMLVWNTNTTLGAGIYSWSGSYWVRIDLPASTPGDSGKFLMSDGKSALWYRIGPVARNAGDTMHLIASPDRYSLLKILDTTFVAKWSVSNTVRLVVPGIVPSDLCFRVAQGTPVLAWCHNGLVDIWKVDQPGVAPDNNLHLICYRPSL